MSEEPIEINEVTPADLMTRINKGDDLVVVDMRQGWEHQAGHIPGAINMFVQEITARFNELPKDKDVIFQCWHGNTSMQATAFLIQNGWDKARVSSLSGGIAGWVESQGQSSLVQD